MLKHNIVLSLLVFRSLDGRQKIRTRLDFFFFFSLCVCVSSTIRKTDVSKKRFSVLLLLLFWDTCVWVNKHKNITGIMFSSSKIIPSFSVRALLRCMEVCPSESYPSSSFSTGDCVFENGTKRRQGCCCFFFPGWSKHPFISLHTLSISSLSSLSFGVGERVEAGACVCRGVPRLEHAVPHHLYKHHGPELVQCFSLHAGAGGRVHESMKVLIHHGAALQHLTAALLRT